MKLYLSNYPHLNTFDIDTVYAILVNGYTYDADDRYVVDVSAYEVSDASYSRVELTGKARVVDVIGGQIKLSADDISFGAVTGSDADGLIIYKHISSDIDSLLLAYWPLEPTTLDGLGFDVTIPASGLVVINNA